MPVFKQEARAIPYKGNQITYTVQGKGHAIVLIPPVGMGKTTFDKLLPLAAHFRIVIADFTGWEANGTPSDQSLVQWYAEAVKVIMDQEGIQEAVIYGYSAGATIAQAFCLLYRSRAKAVILAGGYPKVATKGLSFQYKVGLLVLKVKPEAVIRFLGSAHAKSKSFKRDLEQKMNSSRLDIVYRFFKETYYFDCTKFFPYCTVPFLTIYGKNETWISKHRLYYEILPSHETITIEHSLHQHPIRKAEATIQAIKSFMNKMQKLY